MKKKFTGIAALVAVGVGLAGCAAGGVPGGGSGVALDPDATQVASRLRVRRNPAGDGANEIRLNGDGIAALAVTVDGQPINDWRMDGPDLIVALPGDAHEIGVETLINPAAGPLGVGLVLVVSTLIFAVAGRR